MAKKEEKDVEVAEVAEAPRKGSDLSSLSAKELREIVQPDQVRRIGEVDKKTKRQMEALIELYKRQNPAKYEAKKEELAKDLANCE